MAKVEQLICSTGNHKWTRPPTRGRKPTVCDKHKAVVVVQANSAGEKIQKLHCTIGNHPWERPSARGKQPLNCPEHKPAPTNSLVPLNVATGMVTLHCERGNHDWERTPTRGRKPSNCDKHSVVAVIDPTVEKRKPGRPRIHETEEDRAAAELKRSTDKVNNLEAMLMANGTHISQQTPYILYRKGEEKAGRGKNGPTTEWILVATHSPLMREQFLNTHEADFLAKRFRYERENKVVE